MVIREGETIAKELFVLRINNYIFLDANKKFY